MKSSLNKRICLLGNGWGALAALDGLHKQFDDVIVTSTDKDVIDRARTYGYQASEKIIEHHIDLYLCAGFNEILSEVFITANQVINIHYSLLPLCLLLLLSLPPSLPRCLLLSRPLSLLLGTFFLLFSGSGLLPLVSPRRLRPTTLPDVKSRASSSMSTCPTCTRPVPEMMRQRYGTPVGK